MNKFMIELLEKAFKNYRKTGNATGVTLGSNGDEIVYYHNALESLIKEGYAIPSSDNYDPDFIDPLNPRIEYELTEKGLKYAQTNLVR